jgi:hypothetical protein
MKRQRLSEASAKPAVDAETIPTALPIDVSSTLDQGGTFDDGSRLSGGGSGSRDKGGKCSDAQAITVEVALTNPVPAMLLTDEELAEMDCSSDVLHREIRLIHEEVFVEEQCVLHHPCTFGRDRAPSSISSAMATRPRCWVVMFVSLLQYVMQLRLMLMARSLRTSAWNVHRLLPVLPVHSSVFSTAFVRLNTNNKQ